MSSSSPVQQISCSSQEASHLFRDPLCKHLSCLKRIGNIAFHIFTLGIPLAIYHITLCCFPRRASSIDANSNIQVTGVKSVQSASALIKNLEDEAMAFANTQLAEHEGKLTGSQFDDIGWSSEPIDPRIAPLNKIFWGILVPRLQKLTQGKDHSCWNDEETIQAADAYLKIAYAIGRLTLDDLDAFGKSRFPEMTRAQILAQQGGIHPYRAFYYCTNAYHRMRSASTWKENDFSYGRWMPTDDRRLPASSINRFYQLGTRQNGWRLLYNRYCALTREFVSEKELYKADNRHANWTRPDMPIRSCFSCFRSKIKASFSPYPDTQPT